MSNLLISLPENEKSRNLKHIHTKKVEIADSQTKGNSDWSLNDL